jgi:ParB-like chromosome segregation protein Spo0J
MSARTNLAHAPSPSAADAPRNEPRPVRLLPNADEVDVALRDLRSAPSLRANGLDPAHVAVLAEMPDRWPPIVVRRADMSVVDGQHRVAAARKLRLTHVRAVLFDGSSDDAYVEFVRCNVGHGLPLSLDERRAAVHRILRTHAGRSDRAIAALCGVSPKTVARVRDELGACGALTDGGTRVGRDGRARPIDAAAVRERIAEELQLHPDASLRFIAKKVGASPETVRSVRNRLGLVNEHVASSSPAVVIDPEATVLALLSRTQRRECAWRDDAAMSTRDGGEEFVSWFDATMVDDADAWTYVRAVPLSRTYEIADEARRRASFWSSFAQTLERQVQRRA